MAPWNPSIIGLATDAIYYSCLCLSLRPFGSLGHILRSAKLSTYNTHTQSLSLSRSLCCCPFYEVALTNILYRRRVLYVWHKCFALWANGTSLLETRWGRTHETSMDMVWIAFFFHFSIIQWTWVELDYTFNLSVSVSLMLLVEWVCSYSAQWVR